ncbi:hypothetical protein PGT21_035991 [Puccinia graminis f. sp. tritici]|uniref:Uncharacterized protein n=1 Tax=Puccinia graminis f. sp. tritici TaxID=56615 RepID=A0A5B0R395_PUCGR|nr:hypothetical protein PGT21_035991 [Puccinia graminis f. sp. tritici]
MVQRKTTTNDSTRTTRTEPRHPNSSSKPHSEQNSESDSDSDSNNSNNSDSESSSSDTQPDTNHSDQEQTFILHRHLDYTYQRTPNQSTTTPGFDLFTARTWKLDDQQIDQFSQLNDTDLVQIHYPVPIKQEPVKKLTLADILPPQPQSSSTSSSSVVYNHPPNKTRLSKLSSSPFAGPSVSSLYYSAYSSFAPCYDSTASSQTLHQARIQFQSKQRIDLWSRRADRYHHVLIDPTPAEPPVEPTSNNKKKKSNAPATRGRKRQKTSSSSVAASSPSSSPAKDLPVPISPTKVRQEIDATLLETSKLISNLQERQFDRLRISQDIHLDPSLSTPSMYPRPNPTPNQLVVPEPSREEIAEAYQLVQRLSSVIARRPRPDCTSQDDQDDQMDTSEADQSVIPTAEAIRKSYEVLAIGAGADSASERMVYSGLLPPANPVGIHESTLVSEPNPQLISVLEQSSRSSVSTPRLPMLSSAPQFLPHSLSTAASSRRDPSLSNARIGPAGPPATMLSNPPDLLPNRPAMNGQAVHNNISKLQLLQQQQQQQQTPPVSVNQHHHPALQPDHSIPVRPALPSTTHIGSSSPLDHQRHLHHLQVQKLLATSYAKPATHLMSSPSLTTPVLPTIATPSLKPVAASLAANHHPHLLNSSPHLNPPAHPNHRALASSSSSSLAPSASAVSVASASNPTLH